MWNANKGPDGQMLDPHDKQVLTWDKTKSRAGQWDMGHKPGHEYASLFNRLMSGDITLKEFLQEYRNPNNYHPESPANN